MLYLLDGARIKVQIDLGFGIGDAVTPGAKTETIPCFLNGEPAELIARRDISIPENPLGALNPLP